MTPAMASDSARRQVGYDPSDGTLTVGARTTVVTRDLGDNERLLRTYLDLVTEQREVPADRAVRLRRADITALAELLDLDDADLVDRLTRILRLSELEARDLHRRLVRQRVAAAAIGVGMLAAVPAAAGAAEPVVRTTNVAPADSKAIGAPVEVEVELGPAVRHERPAPGTPQEPDVDIIDALTIER
jgi:hypothetical protein